MLSLEKLLNQELPLNRKERFFTGTVFPMIVCRNNFEHFSIFLEMIGCSEALPVISDPAATNILFFTEYSLVESIVGLTRSRFDDSPKIKDTPDVMILIQGDSGIKYSSY